jgi:acyl-coenzyme A synthetase/AMP-(fatty) acid ligase
MTFSRTIFDAIHSDPARPHLEFERRTFTKGEYAAFADRAVALLDHAGVDPRLSVGVIVRNRPLNAAAMLGLIYSDRWLTSIYAMQSPESIAQDIRESRFAAIIADSSDWSAPALAAARDIGAIGIRLDLEAPEQIAFMPELSELGPGPFRRVEGERGLEILSSGTTGKPKRIVFPSRMLVRAVESVTAGRTGAVDPDIVSWPYAGIGGLCNLVGNAVMGRYTCLLEKFDVAAWADAVERLKPRIVTGMPAMARMILDAEVPREKLSSVKYFYGGSAPMPPELQEQLESTYGIDVIWAYGATEFCGTIIAWTPELHQQYRRSKLGAIGKALPNISLRVTDIATGEVLPPGREGLLEALVPVIGDAWIKTTDIVLIDEDGFVFHKGRGDGAILRGGHKVLPETVVDALRTYPDVLDAAVVGIPDPRLGALPVAAVELRSGASVPSAEELRDHARRRLKAPEVPARVLITQRLPRTPSLKVDLRAVAKMFQDDAKG